MPTANKRKKYFIPNFEARSVGLIAAFTLVAAAAVHAQSTAPALQGTAKASTADIEAAFVSADVNKDGKLDKAEAAVLPAIAERFAQLDTNTDGFLSREEFSKAVGS